MWTATTDILQFANNWDRGARISRPSVHVSGDYYDFLALDDGKLGLLLADVSGKGMPAALLGASLHAAVRATLPAQALVAAR
jgi:serine phosphatase RsbU (regulator of sigma subunit)